MNDEAIRPGANILCLLLLLGCIQRPCFSADVSTTAVPTTANSELASAIGGAWNSDLGPVQLKAESVTADGRVRLTGSWKQDGKEGLILGGIYDGKVIVLDYYLPWSQKYGRWTLEKSDLAGRFKGLNEQPLGTKIGVWNLYRTADLASKPVPPGAGADAPLQVGAQPVITK